MTVGIPDSLLKSPSKTTNKSGKSKPGVSTPSPPTTYIIPRIREDDRRLEVNERAGSGTDADLGFENEGDKNQRYFTDQFVRRRPKWQKSWHAAVAMAVFAVGISSVSSFPETTAENGGLAFIIAYLIAMFALVLPYLYLEGIIGQYFQISFIGIWGICPFLRGITVGVFISCFCLATIYPTFIAWAVFMLVGVAKSIEEGHLVSDDCTNEWNSCHCKPFPLNTDCARHSDNQTVNSAELEYFVGTIIKLWKTKYSDPTIIKDALGNANLSTTYGFHSEDGLGEFNHNLAICLGGTCSLLLLLTWASHKTSGLIYTFSAFFPLVVLILLICRGLTLEGAVAGVVQYFSPDFLQLFEVKLWLTATQTAFFSVGAGFGVHLTTASFNHLHHNVYRDAMGCVLIDTATNLMGCVVNFSFLGHYYWKRQGKVPEVFYDGESAVLFPFTIFLEAVSTISAVGFFATLYYLMIIVFTLDTCAITLQSIVHSVHEEYLRKHPDQNVSEVIFLFGFVGLNFLVSLVFMTRGGIWAVLFVVQYGYTFGFCTYPVLESIAFTWIWGLENVCNAVHTIHGKRPSLYLRICWKYVCPLIFLIFLAIFVFTLSWKPLTLFGNTAPDSTIPIAIFLTFFPVAMFLLYMLIDVIQGARKATGFLTYLMLLLSPEYEHEEIKQNVRNAKRLHWKHYCFLVFPDENIKEMAISEFRNIFSKKNRVFAAGTDEHGNPQNQHQHHHHHRPTHTPSKQSLSAWSLYEEDGAAANTTVPSNKSKPKVVNPGVKKARG